MPSLRHSLFRTPSLLSVLLAGVLLTAGTAQADMPSSCTSDSQRAPRAVLERFTSAHCPDCWQQAPVPAARAGDVVLDWVLPSVGGPATALSAWASPEALERAHSSAKPAGPAPEAWQARLPSQTSGQLRVAQGAVFNDYLGVSMTFKPVARQVGAGPWTGWLALVEVLPVAAQGAVVERRLVRQLLRSEWSAPAGKTTDKAPGQGFGEMRSMRVPDGATPDQLRLVGWVQDARGRVVAVAQTRCLP